MSRRVCVAIGALVVALTGFATPASAQPGSISGTVTNAAGGAGISGISVVACSNDNCFQGTSGFTDGSGLYAISGLTAGSYRIFTQSNGTAFIDRYYPTIECAGCRPSQSGGSLVTVTAGSNTPNINFSLRAGPRIVGTVTAEGGAPLSGVSINVFRTVNSFFSAAFAVTAGDGTFQTGGLPPGVPLTVLTFNSAGYVDRIYNNITCIGGSCSSSSGDSINFASDTSPNATANFTLPTGGRISGRATNRSGGAAIQFASIDFYNTSGNRVGGTSTDSNGDYTSPGLPPGSYFVKAQTFGLPSFIGQLFNDIACAPCDVTSGSAVSVTAGNTTPNINFTMDQAGAISGTITDATTLAGIQNASIQVYTTGGFFLTSTSTAVGGTYTLNGLPTGNYVMKISGPFSNNIYIPKLYVSTAPGGGVTCVNCDVTAGTPISVTQPSTTAGINVALQRGGTVNGTVTANATGNPISNLSVTVLNSTGGFVASGNTDPSGFYSIGGLVAGTYFVRTNTSSTLNFIPEIYAGPGNHVPCVSCPVSSGTALTVTLGGTQTADFSLLAGGTISGTVTMAAGGAPVQGNFIIQLFNNTSSFSISTASTNGSGLFSFTGLPEGTYFVRTNAGQGLIDQVYNSITCVGCTASGGTPIVLASGGTRNDINFSLAAGGRITGKITDLAGAPLASGAGASVSAQIYSSSGQFITSASTNSAGIYLTTVGLPTGTYHVWSSNNLGYINTLYNDISCFSCSVLTGNPVSVTTGNTTSGIDLVLRPGGSLSGTVLGSDAAELEFEPLVNASVQIYSSTGSLVTTATTNSAGNYAAIGLPTDNYTVKTSNGQGFVDELYNNAICMGCDVSSGTPVAVSVGSNTPNINFTLVPGGLITGTVTDAASSSPLSGISVQVYNSIGGFVTSVVTQFDGTYTLRGLATGQYFIRTFNSIGYINVVKASPTNIVCGSCSVTSGTPFSVTAGSTTSGVDLALNLGATIRGRVTSGPPTSTNGIAGVSISIVNPSANGSSVGSATTDSLGNYAVTGVIPGMFLAKTSNSQGFIDEVFDNVECVGCTATNGDFIVINSTPGLVVTGKDFILDAGGRIRGTVTDGTNPLPGITVEVYRTNGTFATSATTNGLGAYVSSGGLPAGDYLVRTKNSQGFVDRVYNGITCVGCSIATVSGTVITLSAAVPSQNGIDFVLSQGGAISGTVTRTSDSAPVQGVFVQVYTEGGTFISSSSTNGLGRYLLKGLPTGNYFVKTSNSLGYIDRLYNAVQCVGCSVTTGQRIAVTIGATTPGIDFALETGGRVTGTVTAAAGGAPIGSVSVLIYNAAGVQVTSGFTSPSGVYVTGGLPAGAYYARTSNSLGFINMLHGSPADIVCASCTVTTGASFAVTLGNSTTINFSLSTGGSISGTVTSEVAGPLAGVSVQVSTATGAFVGSSTTNTAGSYTVGGLPTGDYTVRTSSAPGHVDELYDNVTCVGCSASAGQKVAVTVGVTTGGINFALAAGGLVSGRVTDAATGNGLAGISVQIYNTGNLFVTSVTTDNLGRYTTRAGLPTGTYFARTSNSIGYINVLYPTSTCLSCPPSFGNPISVTAGSTTTDINFSLTLGGRITGTITDATTGLPLQGVSVSVFLPDGSGVGASSTNSLGVFTSPGLPAGTYFARTNNGQGYINQVYNNIPCTRCTIGLGQAISVTTGVATSGINFALSPGGRISGTVTDATTGAPLAGVTVQFYDPSGFVATGAVTNALGQYTSTGGLTTGSYYVRTFNQLGYVNKLYESFTCLQCNPTTGLPVSVTSGATTPNINFALNPGARISGTVRGNGIGLADAFVDLYTSGGTFIGSARTGSGGQYVTGEGLTAGTYYLVSFNDAGFVDELYNNNACGRACAVTSGQGVVVTTAGTTSGIDFDLAPGGRISGRVTSSVTGFGLPNVNIVVTNGAGATVTTGFTDGLGNYTTDGGLATGSYFVRTNANSRTLQHANKLFNDISCAGCDPAASGGTPVAVSTSAITTGIDFVLGGGSVISGTVTSADTGRPIFGVAVRIFDGNGVQVATGSTDDAGAYVTFTALPAGTYYARTQNNLGFVDLRYDGSVCLACDPVLGSPIAVNGTDPVGGINFVMPTGGRISGTVTAATGGAAVAGSKVRFFNTAGSFLGQSFTNGVGAYISPALPAGNYFVRTANTAGLVDQLYPNAPCAPCTLMQGTPVVVVTGGTTPNINFALASGGLISGYVTDRDTGSPIKGVTLNVYRSSDGVLVATTDPTDANGYYQISLPVNPASGSEEYQVEPNPFAGYRPFVPAGLRGSRARSTVNVDTGTETTGVGFALVACSPITVTPATLPLAAKGQLYSSAFSASGGTGPYTFSIVDGNPNTGLSLAPSGLLAGAPVFAGTGNFTVGALDQNQCGGTRVVVLTACSFFLSTTSLSTTASAGSSSVTLTALAADCPWVVTANEPWITVTSAAAGTGNAVVTFSYGPNTTGASRQGTLTIGGQVFTIIQAPSTSSPAFGVVDTPAQGLTGVSGSLALTGWALDDIQVMRVVISRNPVAGEGANEIYIGDATFADGARPDVAAANPSAPLNTRAGWGYLLLTNMLPNQGNGSFTLHMDAIDAEGNTTRIGSRTFVGDNANATKPFGAIDTPGQGATVSGTSFVNFGWALTPNPKNIPTDGSTITVYIDGAPSGNPVYNNFRPDVAGLFPGLANSNGAIGFRILDTTTLTNGVHAIAWVVSDSVGEAEGIGSRYFTVNNILASQRFAPRLASMRASAQASAGNAGPAVSVRLGFDRTQPSLEVQPDALGNRFATVGQLGRLELRFGQACGAVTVSEVVDGERKRQPIGSSVDGSTFSWMPGPAFLGTYQLEFTVPQCGGGETRIPVSVAVLAGR